MRTAVDSSVLLDVLTADPEFGEPSSRALKRACDSGSVVACDVVWAEVRAQFEDEAVFTATLGLLSIEYEAMSEKSATRAGALWRAYCRVHPRRTRTRVVADFLIGAHAASQADVLLARDRGFWREGWENLTVIDPTADH